MSRALLIRSAAFGHYQSKRLANLLTLGPTLRLDAWLKACGVTEIAAVPAQKDWMGFHPWRPGWLPLAASEAEALRAGAALPDLARLGWQDAGEPDLAGLCLRAILDFGALQNPWELKTFLGRVAVRRPKVILEIGTSAGGLLFALGQLADPEATLISIDLPDPRDGLETRAAMPEILASLMRPGQTLHAIRESSTWHGVREDVRRLLAGRSIDLLVIDGDHSYGGVRSDFEMYAGLVAPGGLVAFHDVMVRPENSGRGLDVGVYWQELAREHRTETIADPKGVPGVSSQRNLPFEARRPAALGWGLLFVV